MTIITASPTSVDQMLDARVAQTYAALTDYIMNMQPGSFEAWEHVFDLKEDLTNATFAQQQNFVIQHHLAKTILSTT
jgi:hypothetical protein